MRIQNGPVGLHVAVDGPEGAPPVLFLHGITASAETYGFLVPLLAGRYRMVRLDFRGHGLSDRAPGTYRLAGYASDAVATLEWIGRPAVVVGHSLGGITAAHVAQERPDLVPAVFMEDPPLYMGEPGTYQSTPFALVFPLIQAAVRAMQAEGLPATEYAARSAPAPSVFGGGTIGELVTDDALAAMGEGQCHMDPDVLADVGDGSALAAYDVRKPIGPPGVLLQPDADKGAAFFADHAERLGATSPSVRVVRVPGAGHLIHESRLHRQAYLDALVPFLEAHAR